METTRYYHYMNNTPIGSLTLACDDTGLALVSFGIQEISDGIKQRHPILEQTEVQLWEYFDKKRTGFDIPLNPGGTEFQKRVWHALSTIPYGETRSYSQIAEIIHNPLACRAVGMANHNNPIAIIIPCHRVVGKNGSLTGYAGGLDIKEKLLSFEGIRQ